jgi:hypothetical protein
MINEEEGEGAINVRLPGCPAKHDRSVSILELK